MNYLGIDLGDGESAVAFLTEQSVIEPKMMVLDRQKSILSVVGVSHGNVLIGEKALLDPGIQSLRARFKSRYLLDPSAKADVRRFAMGLFDLMYDMDYQDTKVALGVPAGWTEDEREAYARLVREAGFQNLYTVSESRAAFLCCKHAHSLKVDGLMLEKPALVIDIGSSTTDFAYIVGGRERKIGTFGHLSLGGGVLDALILQDAVAASENKDAIEQVFLKEPTWRNFAELAARRLKEMFFLSADSLPLFGTSVLYYEDPPLPISFTLTEEKMDALLNTPIDDLHGRSFMEALDITLHDAVSATRKNPPELIILTGGASRMVFFQKACQKAFPNALLTVAGEPEYTTAKGLCYAARIDSRMARFKAQVKAYFESGAIERHVDENLSGLAGAICPPLSEYVLTSAVIPAVLKWRQGVGGSLNDLEKQLTRQVAKLLSQEEVAPLIAPHIKDWSRALLGRVQKDLDVILHQCQLDMSLEAMEALFPGATVQELTLVLPGEGIGAIAIGLSGYIAATLFGGSGTALLVAAGLSSPIALIIGAVVGVVVGLLGASYGKSKAKDTPLPLFMRKMLPARLLKKTLSSDKQRLQIEAALNLTMTDRDGAFCRALIQGIAGDITRQLDIFQRDEEIPLQ